MPQTIKHSNLQSWSIIVLGLNEGKTIERVVRDAYAVLQQISNVDGEIVVVNDGSTDDTAAIIEQLQKSIPNLKCITHESNMGIGSALLSGYAASKADNVCAIPADGQFDVSHLLDFPFLEDGTMVSFYRDKNEIYTPYRKVLTNGNRWVVKYIFKTPVRDINWIKIYKNRDLKSVSLELKSSLVESEICIKLLQKGIRLIETPAHYLPRAHGTPKGDSPRIVLSAITELPKLWRAIWRFRKNRKNE